MKYMTSNSELEYIKESVRLDNEMQHIALDHQFRLSKIENVVIAEGYSDDIRNALIEKEMSIYHEQEDGIIAKIIARIKEIIDAILGKKPPTKEIPNEGKTKMPFDALGLRKNIGEIFSGLKQIVSSQNPNGTIKVGETVIKITSVAAIGAGLKTVWEKLNKETEVDNSALSEAVDGASADLEGLSKLTDDTAKGDTATKEVKDGEESAKIIDIIKTFADWVTSKVGAFFGKIGDFFKGAWDKVTGKERKEKEASEQKKTQEENAKYHRIYMDAAQIKFAQTINKKLNGMQYSEFLSKVREINNVTSKNGVTLKKDGAQAVETKLKDLIAKAPNGTSEHTKLKSLFDIANFLKRNGAIANRAAEDIEIEGVKNAQGKIQKFVADKKELDKNTPDEKADENHNESVSFSFNPYDILYS